MPSKGFIAGLNCDDHNLAPVFRGKTGKIVCFYCPECRHIEKPIGRERLIKMEYKR